MSCISIYLMKSIYSWKTAIYGCGQDLKFVGPRQKLSSHGVTDYLTTNTRELELTQFGWEMITWTGFIFIAKKDHALTIKTKPGFSRTWLFKGQERYCWKSNWKLLHCTFRTSWTVYFISFSLYWEKLLDSFILLFRGSKSNMSSDYYSKKNWSSLFTGILQRFFKLSLQLLSAQLCFQIKQHTKRFLMKKKNVQVHRGIKSSGRHSQGWGGAP